MALRVFLAIFGVFWDRCAFGVGGGMDTFEKNQKFEQFPRWNFALFLGFLGGWERGLRYTNKWIKNGVGGAQNAYLSYFFMFTEMPH